MDRTEEPKMSDDTTAYRMRDLSDTPRCKEVSSLMRTNEANFGDLWDLAQSLERELAESKRALADERNRAANAEADYAEACASVERLSVLLRGTANALKGEPKPLRAHGWVDLPDVAARVVASVEALADAGKSALEHYNAHKGEPLSRAMQDLCAALAKLEGK